MLTNIMIWTSTYTNDEGVFKIYENFILPSSRIVVYKQLNTSIQGEQQHIKAIPKFTQEC